MPCISKNLSIYDSLVIGDAVEVSLLLADIVHPIDRRAGATGGRI